MKLHFWLRQQRSRPVTSWCPLPHGAGWGEEVASVPRSFTSLLRSSSEERADSLEAENKSNDMKFKEPKCQQGSRMSMTRLEGHRWQWVTQREDTESWGRSGKGPGPLAWDVLTHSRILIWVNPNCNLYRILGQWKSSSTKKKKKKSEKHRFHKDIHI